MQDPSALAQGQAFLEKTLPDSLQPTLKKVINTLGGGSKPAPPPSARTDDSDSLIPLPERYHHLLVQHVQANYRQVIELLTCL